MKCQHFKRQKPDYRFQYKHCTKAMRQPIEMRCRSVTQIIAPYVNVASYLAEIQAFTSSVNRSLISKTSLVNFETQHSCKCSKTKGCGVAINVLSAVSLASTVTRFRFFRTVYNAVKICEHIDVMQGI
ncbi:hypothetical protein OUZ56_009063 [Daphnia magna]|uniref:Uncharacterized protein n=1 Tax=Daphnia magna TaxID=35525 RepID=A0ABR0AF36_9CRUS|nr:hypothetical protein OUZ56_009063 [Daphnia magna]